MRSNAGILAPAAAPCAILAAVLALVLVLDADDAFPARAAGDPVLVGAGDIADCSGTGDEATARVLDRIGGTVFTLGDNAYEDGTGAEFRDCYAPSWGRHKARTRPAPGNHDYHTLGADGYFGYFGKAAGAPGSGYYSYDRGAWHIVVLNSNCDEVPCAVGSRQERWLQADLAANENVCTLALFHHPRFSSGAHGGQASVYPFWKALYDAGADVVLSGHDHDYERFAPQNPVGVSDPSRGIRQFVVGTGGRELRPFRTIREPNSRAGSSQTFGVLKLTLHPTSYGWKFLPVTGSTFTDSGTGRCHR